MSDKGGNVGLSGQQIAALNVERLQKWIAERDVAGDWADYVRANKLNRTEIANECRFAKSVLVQNPAVRQALEQLEARLAEQKLLVPRISLSDPPDGADAELLEAAKSATAAMKIAMGSRAAAERRIKSLEEKLATTRTELKDTRDQLRRYSYLEEHLQRTGRLLVP